MAAAAAAAAAAPPVSSWTITVSFFEGTLQGFLDSSAFPGLAACAHESEDTYEEIKAAIQEIEQSSAKSIAAGMKDLGKALTSLTSALKDCKAAEADIAKFAKAIEDGFEHPVSFLFHVGKELIVNGRDIYADITKAVADWKAGSYRASGEQVGLALAKLLVPAFDSWRQSHRKMYVTAEDEARARAAYELNSDLVRASHLQRAAGVHLHLNEFADLSPAEFAMTRNGYLPGARPKATCTHSLSGKPTPMSVDWRAHGLVADVKNQGSCGSCWAFSAVVSIEGQHAKKTGKLTSLSEQNLVDCVKHVKLPNDTSTCCMGCRGGLMDDAFSYVLTQQKGMIDTEAEYPYSGHADTCAYSDAKEGASITGWTDVPAGDEEALLDAVATVGPVSIAVDAAIGWQLYFGGIMHPTLCSSNPKKMDHGVAIVGYGTEKGKDYWIVRNSWGATWGEKGYVRIVRGKNACGLANAASYPTGVTSVEEA